VVLKHPKEPALAAYYIAHSKQENKHSRGQSSITPDSTTSYTLIPITLNYQATILTRNFLLWKNLGS